jgi:hypothetical protein
MIIPTLKLARPSWSRSLLVGAAASTAYLAEMAIDMRVTSNRYDDRVLLGGFFARSPDRQKLVGTLIHYGVGVAVAAAYQAVSPSLPRVPGWLRAQIFIHLENTLSFPSVALADLIHPAVQDGTLPSLLTWQDFWIVSARHAAYGLVLDLLGEAE